MVSGGVQLVYISPETLLQDKQWRATTGTGVSQAGLWKQLVYVYRGKNTLLTLAAQVRCAWLNHCPACVARCF